MKSRFTHPLPQVVLTSIVTIAVSVGCSASRSAGSPAQVTDNPTISQSSSPIVSSSAQEKATCTLNMSHAPVLFGLKLGMTQDEVLDLFPGSKEDKELRSHLTGPTSEFGNSSFALFPSKYPSKEKFAGISQVALGLLDGRVSNYTLGYNGPEYSHVNDFVTKIARDGDLPLADQWEPYAGLEHQLKILRCIDFEVRVFAGGPGGSQNYIVVTDTEAVKKLKERRKKAREQASPTPGQ
jgi:hypothetical protein